MKITMVDSIFLKRIEKIFSDFIGLTPFIFTKSR
jgi:hypothetical protein